VTNIAKVPQEHTATASLKNDTNHLSYIICMGSTGTKYHYRTNGKHYQHSQNIKKSNGFLVVIADFIVEDFIAAAFIVFPL